MALFAAVVEIGEGIRSLKKMTSTSPWVVD